jgi:phosphate starvation-inducible protein PhoH and related proteins
VEVTVQVPLGPDHLGIVGAAERNLKMIRETLGVNITSREGSVRLSGERAAVSVARNVLERLGASREQGMTREAVLSLIADENERYKSGRSRMSREAGSRSMRWEGGLDVYASGSPLRARTPNQEVYLEAIRRHDLVFGIGPAGTGKTYLAVAAAVHLLRTDRARKVILARPAVEAGERLGFLPGDIEAKVNPYLRPLFDALNDMMDYNTIRRFIETDVVEVVPLAFMRGRTLNNAVIILDEAQNTTRGQMHMFLTRMGHGSKMIVTGDPTQIDLPDPRESGLIDAARRLMRVRGVEFVQFDRGDVVRHELVQRIVDAYGGDRREGTGFRMEDLAEGGMEANPGGDRGGESGDGVSGSVDAVAGSSMVQPPESRH